MRIDALVARRNDSVTRQPPLRHDRRIDGGLEDFRSQARTIEIEVAVASDLCSLKGPDAGLKPQFRDPQRFGDVFYLVGGFCFSLGEKRVPFDLYCKAFGPQLVGQQSGKVRRDDKERIPLSRKSRSRTSIIAGLGFPILRNFFW